MGYLKEVDVLNVLAVRFCGGSTSVTREKLSLDLVVVLFLAPTFRTVFADSSGQGVPRSVNRMGILLAAKTIFFLICTSVLLTTT